MIISTFHPFHYLKIDILPRKQQELASIKSKLFIQFLICPYFLVTVINTQRKFKVNLKEMFLDVGIIMKILGLQEFDVSMLEYQPYYIYLELSQVKLSFITDRNMFGLNSQYQGKEKSTDVLSFPKNDVRTNTFSMFTIFFPPNLMNNQIKQPEVLKHPSANLGNIYISPEYVNEVMKEDKEYFEKMVLTFILTC